MSSVEFDDLVAAHGFEKAQELFETFKTSKPTTDISPDFAMQIVARLSDLYVKIEKTEWGLENPDSDSNLQWCEHFHLIIPQFDAKVLVEVGNSHYYVRFESGSDDSDDDTFKYWEDIPEFIARCVHVFHGTLYAQLVMDESREFPFGVMTFADGLCTDSVDDFWHSTNEDRARSVQAWGYIVVNQGEENVQNGIEPPKDFDEFLDFYGFVENTGAFACGGSIDDKSYGWETFSPDIDEIVKIANSEPGRVHTVVDGDDGRLWLTSGYHLVNRIFYIITQKPYLGPDFDIPCEEPKDFNRLSLEEFKAVDPDEEIYWAEHGGYYDKQAFLDLAKGDESLAYRLYALCEWQCPETVIDEDSGVPLGDCAFPGLRNAEVLDEQPDGVEPLFSEYLGIKGVDDKPRDRLGDMRGLVEFAQEELNINFGQILEIYGLQNFEECAFYRECAKELVSYGYFVYNDDWFEIYSKESIIEYVAKQ